MICPESHASLQWSWGLNGGSLQTLCPGGNPGVGLDAGRGRTVSPLERPGSSLGGREELDRGYGAGRLAQEVTIPLPVCHRCLSSIQTAAGRATSTRARGAPTAWATFPRASSRWSASGWVSWHPASPLCPPPCAQASPGRHSPLPRSPCIPSPMASCPGWASAQTAQVRPPREWVGRYWAPG